jgi:hypothetical protein
VPPEHAAALGYMDDVVVEIADRKCIQTLDVFQVLGDGGRQRLTFSCRRGASSA